MSLLDLLNRRQKAQALKIMERLKLTPKVIDDFRAGGISYFQSDNCPIEYDALYVQDKIEELELSNCNNCVYCVTHEQLFFGEVYSFLIVPKYEEDWQYICQKLSDDTYRVYAHCENVTHPECSESGYIVVKVVNGQLVRIG